MPALITFGHGTASADDLAMLVRETGVALVVDVRIAPGSRTHPHVARAELEAWLPQRSGSAYLWCPDLGGFRPRDPRSTNVALRNASFRAYADYMETAPFRDALAALLVHAARRRTAIMCSESLWWRCHRRLIADAATLLHGLEVRHLMHDGTLRPHLPTAGVRVAAPRTLRYDVVG